MENRIENRLRTAYPRNGEYNGIVFLSTQVEEQSGQIHRARPGYIFVHDSWSGFNPTTLRQVRARKRPVKKAIKLLMREFA